MKKVVILFSGGLDSYIMMELARSRNIDFTLVHYDIGQPYSKKEMIAIKNIQYPVDVRIVEWLASGQELIGKTETNSGNIFIPGRNMVLASLAASTFMPDEVWMGGLKGEDHAKSTDKNQEFIDRTNHLWSYVYSPFETVPKLVFPLIDMNWGKFEAVEWVYKTNKSSVLDILSTSSCLQDTPGKNCGVCVVCCRRKYIFLQLGFMEEYETDPLVGVDNLKMIISMLSGDLTDLGNPPHYDAWRCREILPGLYMEFQTDDHAKLIDIMKSKLKAIQK